MPKKKSSTKVVTHHLVPYETEMLTSFGQSRATLFSKIEHSTGLAWEGLYLATPILGCANAVAAFPYKNANFPGSHSRPKATDCQVFWLGFTDCFAVLKVESRSPTN